MKELDNAFDYVAQFEADREENLRRMNEDPETARVTDAFVKQVGKYQYPYHFTWMGRPIIQFPQDLITLQEAIMRVKPDLIIETGIAHGGSAVFYASMLELLGDSNGIKREVVAVDIDLRAHNRKALEEHPMWKRITVLDGSSTDESIVAIVSEIASRHSVILAVLDSNHTHDHVYRELSLYAPLVTPGSYIVVLDTCVELWGDDRDRPWGKGNNPYSAVQQWLKENDDFSVDRMPDKQSIITSCPEGWLLRVK